MNKNTDSLVKNSEDLGTKSDGLQHSINNVVDNTEELKNQIAKLNQDIDEAKKQMGDLGEAFQLKATSEMRQAALERLDHVSGVKAKIVEAAKFVAALDFQLWKPDPDTQSTRHFTREDLMDLGINEFLATWNNYADQLSASDIQKVALTSKNAATETLIALSFVVDLLNPLQIQNAERARFSSWNLYQGFEQGLGASSSMLDLNARSKWESSVALQSAAALAIRDWRANSLLSASLQLLVVHDLGFKDGFDSLFGLKVDLAALNQTQIKQVEVFLTQALAGMNKAQKTGAPVQLNKLIKKFYRKLEIVDTRGSSSKAVASLRALVEHVKAFK